MNLHELITEEQKRELHVRLTRYSIDPEAGDFMGKC
jgi:hypothetical protein